MAIRNIRRDAMEAFKKKEKAVRDHGGRSEAGCEKDLQKHDGRAAARSWTRSLAKKETGTDGGVKAAGASGGSTAARRGHCTFCKVLSPFQGL